MMHFLKNVLIQVINNEIMIVIYFIEWLFDNIIH